MVVNDDAGYLMPRGVLEFFASRLAPTVKVFAIFSELAVRLRQFSAIVGMLPVRSRTPLPLDFFFSRFILIYFGIRLFFLCCHVLTSLPEKGIGHQP
jgi:hypothetical protein